MNGLKGFWPARRWAPSAMLTAWSPMRSRSLLIFERRDEEAQVDRHGLLQREQLDRLLLDLHFHAVDLLVGRDDLLRLPLVGLDQGLDRTLDLALDLAPEEDQVAAQLLELLGEMFFHRLRPLLSPRGPRSTGSPGPSGALSPHARRAPLCSETRRSKTRSKRSAFRRDSVSSASQSAASRHGQLDAARPEAAFDSRDELPVAAVEPVGDPHDGRELLDDGTQVRVEPLPVLVPRLRPPALVIPGDRGEDLDLVRGEAGQVAVRDQVVRVALVLRVADVAADVVEQRAVLEPLPLGRGELVEGMRLVEDLESQPRHVGGVEDLGVPAAQEPVDRAGAHVPIEHPLLPVPGHVVEEDPLSQPPLPHDDRLRAGALQDPGEEHAAGDRDVAAAGVEPRDPELLAGGRPPEQAVDLLQSLAGQGPVARRCRLAPQDRGLVHERERLDRAGRADTGLEPRLANRVHGALGRRPDRLLHRAAILVARGVVSRIAIRQAHDAEGKALRQPDPGALGDHELRRAAADVHEEHRVEPRGKLAADPEVDEARLLFPGNDVHGDARAAPDAPRGNRRNSRPPARRKSRPPARAPPPPPGSTGRNCSTAATPASIASSDSRPVASVSLPRRTSDFSRERTWRDPSSSTEAIRSLIELVPMSIAASCFTAAEFSGGDPRPS